MRVAVVMIQSHTKAALAKMGQQVQGPLRTVDNPGIADHFTAYFFTDTDGRYNTAAKKRAQCRWMLGSQAVTSAAPH